MKTDSLTQIKSIFVQAEPILKKNKKQKDIDTIKKYLENIDDREVNVLICGEFKRGKSSFINAFLEQEICPVDHDIATAAVSVIKYGDKVKITRQYGDINNLQAEVFQSLDCINTFAAGHNIDNTVLLIIEIPNDKLKNGLVLIDTPGVGGLDPRHAFLTNYFLPKANIVLFITDKDQPITGAEKSFFDNKIIPFAKQKALIINKADLSKSDAETDKWIEDAKKKCSQSNSTLSVIAVSSKLKREFLKKNNQDYLKESNFGEIDNLIDNLTEGYKKTLLVELRDYIVSVFNEMIIPLKMQIEQIKEPNPELLDKLRKELADYQSQKLQLENPNSEYRMKINKIISDTRTTVQNKLKKENIILTGQELTKILNNKRFADEEAKASYLNNYMMQLASDANLVIDSSFKQIVYMLGRDDMDIEGDPDFDLEFDITIERSQKTVGKKMVDFGRNALPSVGIAGLATMLLGPIGLLAAPVMYYLFNKESKKVSNVIELKEQVIPQLQIAMQDINAYIEKRFADFNIQLVKILQESAQKLIDSMTEVIKDLKKLETESAEAKRKKSSLLENDIKPMEQILVNTKILMTNPFDKNSQPAAPVPAPILSNDDKTVF